VLDDFFWSQYNQGVGVGSTDPADTFAYHKDSTQFDLTIKDNSVFTIIDSGSNAIYFSALYYEGFILKIFD